MPVGHQHLLGVGEAGLLGQGATRTVRRSRRPWPRSTVTLGGGKRPLGELADRRHQPRLVLLGHQQVVRVPLGDQVAGVVTLAVQRIGGDHPPGQVHLLQQRPKPGDLVALPPTRGWASTVPCCWSSAASRCTRRPPVSTAPRSVLPSTATAPSSVAVPSASAGGCRAASHPPTSRSSACASTRCNARRMVASSGGVSRPV
jgi:hypothetical protein